MERLLLTNRKGGYALLGEPLRSRFEGVYAKKDSLFKFIESIAFDRPADSATNLLWCVERQRGSCRERMLMPTGRDSLLIDLTEPIEMTLFMDCKEPYDNKTWGREYEAATDRGIVVITFRKRNDSREEQGKEYELYLAAAGDSLEYIPLRQWEEHSYSLDASRGSQPSTRWVYAAAKLRSKRISIGMATTRDEAIKQAKDTLKNADKIMKEEEQRMADLLNEEPEGKNGIARRCCVAALDALSLDDGIYAGLPWFFQFWARDEIICTKGLMLAGKTHLAKMILMRHLASLKDGWLYSNPESRLKAADAPGWLFLRLRDLIEHDELSTTKTLGAAERRVVMDKVTSYLDNVEQRLDHGLLPTGPLETWMDTSFEGDDRSGCRIEIQALVLASCRLYTKLTKRIHNVELIMNAAVKKQLVKGTSLLDGKDDNTIRPNIFIAAYAYPALFTRKEWAAIFKKALPSLWLPWGGLSSIDRHSPLFSAKYTGEDNRSYHRGDSWFWVNNLAAMAMLRADKSLDKKANAILAASVREMMTMGASGFCAEVSSAEALRSEGCLAQAWSSATLLELLHETQG